MLEILGRNRQGRIVSSLTNSALEYQHEITHGPFQASWRLEDGHGGVDHTGLRFWFNNKMLSPVSAAFNSLEVWRGSVWEMELHLGSRHYKASAEKMVNVVWGQYNDEDGNEQFVGPIISNTSRSDYIFSEDVVSVSSTSSEEALEAARQVVLYNSNPYVYPPVFYDSSDTNYLTIRAVGNSAMGNMVKLFPRSLRWHPDHGYRNADERFEKWGEETTVSAEIRRILDLLNWYGGADNQSGLLGTTFDSPSERQGYLWPLEIANNSRVTAKGVSSVMGCWDRILELVKLPDNSGRYYQMEVTNNGGVVYTRASYAPKYYSFPEPTGITLSDRTTKPTWEARPGIVRIADPFIHPVRLPDLPGIPDPRDVPIERVVMRMGDEFPGFHSLEVDEAERRAAIEANNRWITEAAERREER